MKRYEEIFYQLTDFIIAYILLGVTSPLFMLAAILVKLDSPGQIFYKQKSTFLFTSILLMNTSSIPVNLVEQAKKAYANPDTWFVPITEASFVNVEQRIFAEAGYKFYY